MSAPVQTQKYYEALERLKARGAAISNDAVSIEAGSGRGSIKRSRPAHAELISAIDAAAAEQAQAKQDSDPTPELRDQVKQFEHRLDQSMDRELALLKEVLDQRLTIKQMAEEIRQLKMGRLVAVQ
ncbi:hypothetical protein LNV09_10335 [Paucibacter sp. B2R-40]|uniref:hypothetical protein n=1 Tax=Paucibacter sp. B2R-40 TaxID=2893554 RepID=UPI0021E3F070|nr:hypothetical protein [Paucibacter sp. B2R-40]MCV2354560.1 hypothetical protein [Paucibacter sp. B2R-40]